MVRAFLGRDPQTQKRLSQNKMIHGSKRDAERALAEIVRKRDFGR